MPIRCLVPLLVSVSVVAGCGSKSEETKPPTPEQSEQVRQEAAQAATECSDSGLTGEPFFVCIETKTGIRVERPGPDGYYDTNE